MGQSDPYRAALVTECQAAECYDQLCDYFTSRNVGFAAALCRNLATRHERAIGMLEEAGMSRAGADPWMDATAREFVMRVASAHQLLEVALAMEQDAMRDYAALRGASPDGPVQDLLARLYAMASENARRLGEALESLPAAPDWEELIASGAVPALALGAERRLRRPH